MLAFFLIGPTLPLLSPRAIGNALQRIDAGLGEAPWTVRCPGFFVDVPIAFVGFSATEPDDPLPELHVHDPAARGPRTIPEAFIQFQRRRVAVSAMRITGPCEVDESVLESDSGMIRTWV